MGVLLDITPRLDTARAERKVIRAETHPELFEHRDLQSYELYRSNMIQDIILPPNPEET